MASRSFDRFRFLFAAEAASFTKTVFNATCFFDQQPFIERMASHSFDRFRFLFTARTSSFTYTIGSTGFHPHEKPFTKYMLMFFRSRRKFFRYACFFFRKLRFSIGTALCTSRCSVCQFRIFAGREKRHTKKNGKQRRKHHFLHYIFSPLVYFDLLLSHTISFSVSSESSDFFGFFP